MKTIPKRPSVAQFISFHLSISDRSQKEIAEEIGFEKPNVLTMIKQGTTKLPLARVGAFAKALDVDAAYLLRLALQEYTPETWAAIEDVFSGRLLTQNELLLVKVFRRFTNDTDPEVVVGDDADTLDLGLIVPKYVSEPEDESEDESSD
jgi:transcriptional regulator with XRE-family HTH domain